MSFKNFPLKFDRVAFAHSGREAVIADQNTPFELTFAWLIAAAAQSYLDAWDEAEKKSPLKLSKEGLTFVVVHSFLLCLVGSRNALDRDRYTNQLGTPDLFLRLAQELEAGTVAFPPLLRVPGAPHTELFLAPGLANGVRISRFKACMRAVDKLADGIAVGAYSTTMAKETDSFIKRLEGMPQRLRAVGTSGACYAADFLDFVATWNYPIDRALVLTR